MNRFPVPGSSTTPGYADDAWAVAAALAARAANQSVVDGVQWAYDAAVWVEGQAQVGGSIARSLLPPGFARDAAAIVFDLQSELARNGQQAVTRWARAVAYKAFGFGY